MKQNKKERLKGMKPLFCLKRIALSVTLLGACTTHAAVAENGDSVEKKHYSPMANTPYMTNLYWGDTHLHTAASADAYIMNGILGREDAYRFAKGELVNSNTGLPVQLRRPLDFLAITDHAEYLGVLPKLKAGDEALISNWELGRRWAEYMKNNQQSDLILEFSAAIQSTDPEKLREPAEQRQTIWDEVAEAADKHNEPGQFTAFVGYEWTSMRGGDNLHRVVIYKDGQDKANESLPFTAQDSTDPEDLWAALETFEETTGGEVLAIAHNGNVSNGRMFAPITNSGKPLDAAYATKRIRWEPVYEVTQVKGDGETHPTLSPDDEFADFETWDQGNISLTVKKTPEMLPHEYARSALRQDRKSVV